MKNNYRILKNTLLHDGFFKLKELTLKYKKHNGDWSQKINREIFVGASVAAVLPSPSPTLLPITPPRMAPNSFLSVTPSPDR